MLGQSAVVPIMAGDWWVRARLRAWGHWARGGIPSMPTMSTTEKARIGRGGVPIDDMPIPIAEVDSAVRRAPADQRIVLILTYAQPGPIYAKAQRLHITRWTFKRRLERAESFIALNL